MDENNSYRLTFNEEIKKIFSPIQRDVNSGTRVKATNNVFTQPIPEAIFTLVDNT